MFVLKMQNNFYEISKRKKWSKVNTDDFRIVRVRFVFQMIVFPVFAGVALRRFELLTLHSDMQTLDHRKLRISSPAGVRKIVSVSCLCVVRLMIRKLKMNLNDDMLDFRFCPPMLLRRTSPWMTWCLWSTPGWSERCVQGDTHTQLELCIDCQYVTCLCLTEMLWCCQWSVNVEDLLDLQKQRSSEDGEVMQSIFFQSTLWPRSVGAWLISH